jgi:beta-glucosidase
MMLGNYNGTPSHPVTILEGIKRLVGTNTQIIYEPGPPLALRKSDDGHAPVQATMRALEAAWAADVVIYVGGISPRLEGEEMRVDYDGFVGGDRTRIELPAVQTEFLKSLHDSGKPVIFVNCSGSAMAIPWETRNLPAILQAWYPGEQGGLAVAEVLFGDTNPSGRLPVTFYNATADLPAFDDYSMSNRTYRYFNGTPLFGFGHGLSYTRFEYRDAKLSSATVRPGDSLKLSFSVANIGARDGDEVPQVYFRHLKSAVPQPNLALCAFGRVRVARGKSAAFTMDIPVERFRFWDPAKKQYVVEPGDYEILIGASSDDIRRQLPLKVVAR